MIYTLLCNKKYILYSLPCIKFVGGKEYEKEIKFKLVYIQK